VKVMISEEDRALEKEAISKLFYLFHKYGGNVIRGSINENGYFGVRREIVIKLKPLEEEE